MQFIFVVNVEIEREQGKFASRDELAQELEQAIADADPGTIEGDNGGEYSISSWNVALSQ